MLLSEDDGHGVALVYGLAPDGVSQVDVALGQSAMATAPVVKNVFVTHVAGDAGAQPAVMFDGPAAWSKVL